MKLVAVSVGILLTLSVSCVDSERSDLEREVIHKGFEWLMEQQGADGGWHSRTYGSMKGGSSLTSLVLYTAAQLPRELVDPYTDKLQLGWAYLAPGLREKGKVTAPDGEYDYPTYSAALLLSAVILLDLGQTPEDVGILVDYLCRVQLDSEDGFEPGSPDYGGWDLMGDVERDGSTLGTSISVSRLVLEALHPLRESADVANSHQLALQWIGGLQNLESDGGFYFHPEGLHLGNKAGWSNPEQNQPRSYGTCTADGLVALKYLPDNDELAERTKAAANWLVREAGVDEVPGFGFEPPEKGWEQGLRFYYLNALSAALPYLPEERASKLSTEIKAALEAEFYPKGFWQNESARMREDDPIISTCFALAALGRLYGK